MKDFESVIQYQTKQFYLSPKDLMYRQEYGFLMSRYDLDLFLRYKEKLASNSLWPTNKQNLKCFNGKAMFYCSSNELNQLKNEYMELITEDLLDNGNLLTNRMKSNLYYSRIYSEIEGTLNVENVPTTRKRLKDIIENNKPLETKNDIIIKNMDLAINFVLERPKFNKDNLLKLYNILSKDCLDEENKLRPGDYYRYDSVEVDNYQGCPVDQIEDCMNSLFKYVNDKLKSGPNIDLPHICHYYIVYIHPYFDYNGRTARMVSLWIHLLTNQFLFPPLISEAINQTKSKYYVALQNTRDTHNDLTYFLIYIYETSIRYYLCYRNIEYIDEYVKNKGEVLTDTELNYIKKILISRKSKFTYIDFLKMCQIEMTKQGALKILNKLVDYNILTVINTKSKSKIFDVNKQIIKYEI